MSAIHDRRVRHRSDGQLAVGGIPLERLAERVGATPFFAYDRRCSPSASRSLRATLPAGIELSYAVKANPMPAVVQHLAARRLASTSPRPARCASRSTRRCRATRSASPARARRPPS